MKFFIFIFSIYIVSSGNLINSKELEVIGDNDLVHLIKESDSLVVLFTKTNCKDCENYEKVVANLYDDFVDSGANVVRLHNSPMVSIYNPNKEPSLIFFRKGVPLLYYGKINEDDVMSKFNDNKEPVVKELADINFEHLTQASTGATTGDWLIFFYSNDCVICQRLYAVYEAVGAQLKRKMNAARVNRLEGGISTAKRFEIETSPEFILLKQGKYYRLKITELTVDNFIKFIDQDYKQMKGENVPVETKPSIDIYGLGLTFVKDYPYLAIFLIAISGLTAIVLLLKSSWPSKKTKTENKTKKSK